MNLDDMANYITDNVSGNAKDKNLLYTEFLMEYALLTVKCKAEKPITLLVQDLMLSPANIIDGLKTDYEFCVINDTRLSLPLPGEKLKISKVPTPTSQVKDLNEGRARFVAQGNYRLRASDLKGLESALGADTVNDFQGLHASERAQEYFSRMPTQTIVFRCGPEIEYTLTTIRDFEIMYRNTKVSPGNGLHSLDN